MEFNLQPKHLINEKVHLIPLQASDLDRLYEVASNQLVWEQHPTPTRYKKEVFQIYFDGAILSKGAFIVLDAKTNQVVGSSRFYDIDEENKSIKIGYTFIGIDFWGKDFNRNMKTLMINYAFTKFDKVIFDVGATNLRSQKAVQKIGGTKIGEEEVAYYGENVKLNFVYQISK